MSRRSFESDLQRMQDDVLSLGSMAEDALIGGAQLLKSWDQQAARHLIAADRAINSYRLQIESDCLILIATQQPMARDLRFLAGVLEIATELERLGDYGKGIARIVLLMECRPALAPLTLIPEMVVLVRAMLHGALTAFSERNADLARQIARQDDEVDRLYNRINRALIDQILANPTCVDQANNLMWAAHNMERAGDRVVNICERVIFTVTGEMRELDVVDQFSMDNAQ